MAEQTLSLNRSFFRYQSSNRTKGWFSGTSLGAIDNDLVVTAGTVLTSLLFHDNGNTVIQLEPGRRDFTDAVEASGLFTLVADGQSVDFGIFNADMMDTYAWTPSNSAEIIAFYNAIGTSNVAATLTLRDFAPAAPSFTDPTGDAITGTVGEAIAAITVPAASGTPAPTYAVVGALPAGLRLEAYQETFGSGNEQTFNMLSSWSVVSSNSVRWIAPDNQRPAVDSAFGASRFFGELQVGRFVNQATGILLAAAQTGSAGTAGDDLSDAFETNGSFVVSLENSSFTVELAGRDLREPYIFASTAAERAWADMVAALSSNQRTPTLTIRDYVPNQRQRARIVGTPTEAGSGTIRIRATNSAGSADWSAPYEFEPDVIGIYFGTQQMRRVYLGATEIERIYRGTTRIL